MNKLKTILLLTLFSYVSVFGQNSTEPYKLGSVYVVKETLKTNLRSAKSTSPGSIDPKIVLEINEQESYTLDVKYQNETSSAFTLIGKIADKPNSTFYLSLDESTTKGHIVLKDEKKAFEYYCDKNGNVFVREKDIDKVLCIEYPEAHEEHIHTKSGTTSFSVKSAYDLQSLPGAEACIMLDFDGYELPSGTGWLDGSSWTAPASGMTDNAIQETWQLVSEDYRPFNVNVTTSQSVFDSYAVSRRVRCVFTPDNSPAPGSGGVAYVGAFGYKDWPCWVFMMSSKAGGEAASHEVGHTLGLGHDGRTNPSEEYFFGHEDWAPIMGAGYYVSVSQWSCGEYDYANNQQDDLAVMSNYIYLRSDDYGNDFSGAQFIDKDASGNIIAQSGVIERDSDIDMFYFTCGTGNVHFDITTLSQHGDLDILVKLYEGSSGSQIGEFNSTGLDCSFDAYLDEGQYYIGVDGTGYGDAGTTGYSDYASLGSYSISGTVTPGGNDDQSSEGVVTVYLDCYYKGTSATLSVGDYNMSDLTALGITNDAISSIAIQNGYKVELFWNINYAGSSLVLTSDNDCLVDEGWNDEVTSLKITPNGVSGLNGTYTLENRNSGLVMDVYYGIIDDGTNILQYTSGGTTNQKFILSELNNGMYSIINVQTGKAVDIEDNSSENFANVQQWSYGATANQKFIIQATDNDYYKFIAAHSGKIIEVGYASTEANANINQYDDNGQTCGQWKLVSVEKNSVTTTIEAEDFDDQYGTEVEDCSEGGQNVGYIDAGDWLVYSDITFPTSGYYTIDCRVASLNGSELSLDLNAGSIVLGSVTILSTGDWQSWTTVSQTVSVDAGTYNLGIYAPVGGTNINWIQISQGVKSVEAIASLKSDIEVFPIPSSDILNIQELSENGSTIDIINVDGRVLYTKQISEEYGTINISELNNGIYFIKINSANQSKTIRFIKK